MKTQISEVLQVHVKSAMGVLQLRRFSQANQRFDGSSSNNFWQYDK